MSDEARVGFMSCDVCGQSIERGEPYVGVEFHIERMDQPDVIEVERAEPVLTACISCAPSRTQVSEAVRSLLG